MNVVETTPSFNRAYKKFVKNNPRLMQKIDAAMEQMKTDLNAPFLETHKLGGKFSGILSCSCGYNCRILFEIYTDKKTRQETITLLSIGTHDEVY